MSTIPHFNEHYLELAIFRLSEVCIRVQEEMEDFLSTAGVEPNPEMVSVFRWLRKRKVAICLLSDFDRRTTELLLSRLNWSVGAAETVQYVICRQSRKEDPIAEAIALAGLNRSAQAFCLVDTLRLLELGKRNGLGLSLAYSNGQASYQELMKISGVDILDKVVQLPNHLLTELQVQDQPTAARRQQHRLPLLWHPGRSA